VSNCDANYVILESCKSPMNMMSRFVIKKKKKKKKLNALRISSRKMGCGMQERLIFFVCLLKLKRRI